MMLSLLKSVLAARDTRKEHLNGITGQDRADGVEVAPGPGAVVRIQLLSLQGGT
jgi:hypothetical protein